MICPTCASENRKSVVHAGPSYSTAMYAAPYYDEDGRYHDHDPNTTYTQYVCSNGHSWQEWSHAPCPTCGQHRLVDKPKRPVDVEKLAAEAREWDKGAKKKETTNESG